MVIRNTFPDGKVAVAGHESELAGALIVSVTRALRESATPRRMSCSETVTSSSSNAAIASSSTAMPATIVGARSGCRPGSARRSAQRHHGRALEQLLELAARSQQVSLDRGGVVGLELEQHRRARRGRAGDGDAGLDRRSRRWSAKVSATSARSAASWSARRRVVMQVALAVADDADLRRDVEQQLARRGRRRARSSRRRCRRRASSRCRAAAARGAEVGQLRLLVAGDRARVDPKRPRTSAVSSAPLAASRAALVRTPVATSTSSSSIAARYSSSAATTRSIASSASTPVRSRPGRAG